MEPGVSFNRQPTKQFLVLLLLLAAVVASWPFVTMQAEASDFKRLKNAAIRKAMIGKDYTDDVHWSFRFKPDGKIEGANMGQKSSRTWMVRDDKLCLINQAGEDCREVWKSGSRIELRRYIDDPVADSGVVRKPRQP
jgi:hypothetical protein